MDKKAGLKVHDSYVQRLMWTSSSIMRNELNYIIIEKIGQHISYLKQIILSLLSAQFICLKLILCNYNRGTFSTKLEKLSSSRTQLSTIPPSGTETHPFSVWSVPKMSLLF